MSRDLSRYYHHQPQQQPRVRPVSGLEAPEVATLVAAMTTPPSTARRQRIAALISDLKISGVWAKLDVLYVLAAADAQAAGLNWVAPSTFALTAVNTPTFAADRGYTGNGTSSYLNSGWNPTVVASPKFVQDSATQGAWVTTNVLSATANDMGGLRSRMNTRAGTLSVVGNSSSGVNGTLPATTSVGFGSWTRAASTDVTLYKNGAIIATPAITSAAPVSGEWYIGAYNASSTATQTPAGYSTRQIAAATWGSALTAAQMAALYAALADYMTAVGAA